MTTTKALFILYMMSILMIVFVVANKLVLEKQVEDNKKLLKIIIEILKEQRGEDK